MSSARPTRVLHKPSSFGSRAFEPRAGTRIERRSSEDPVDSPEERVLFACAAIERPPPTRYACSAGNRSAERLRAFDPRVRGIGFDGVHRLRKCGRYARSRMCGRHLGKIGLVYYGMELPGGAVCENLSNSSFNNHSWQSNVQIRYVGSD